jgi:hypothetical protein
VRTRRGDPLERLDQRAPGVRVEPGQRGVEALGVQDAVGGDPARALGRQQRREAPLVRAVAGAPEEPPPGEVLDEHRRRGPGKREVIGDLAERHARGPRLVIRLFGRREVATKLDASLDRLAALFATASSAAPG